MEQWGPATMAAMDAATDLRSPRLTGLDAARGLAVLGMAVVNYDVVLTFGVDEPSALAQVPDLLDNTCGVGHRLGVGHRVHRGEPTERRGP